MMSNCPELREAKRCLDDEMFLVLGMLSSIYIFHNQKVRVASRKDVDRATKIYFTRRVGQHFLVVPCDVVA